MPAVRSSVATKWRRSCTRTWSRSKSFRFLVQRAVTTFGFQGRQPVGSSVKTCSSAPIGSASIRFRTCEVFAQRHDGLCREGHEPDVASFGGLERHAGAFDDGDGAFDPDRARIEVDVGPSQGADFAASRAGRQGDVKPTRERPVVRFEICDGGAHLFRVGRSNVDAWHFGAGCGGDDIVGEPSPTHRLRDRAVQHDVRAPNARRSESNLAETRVELVAVAGSETTERDRSDVVDDMAIEEALPVCSGRGCERRGVHERVEEARHGVGFLGEARAGFFDEVLQRSVRVASGPDDRLGEPSSLSGERVGFGSDLESPPVLASLTDRSRACLRHDSLIGTHEPNCTRNCTKASPDRRANRAMFIGANALVGRRRVTFASSELHPNAPGMPIGPPRIDGRSAPDLQRCHRAGDQDRTGVLSLGRR